MISTNYPANFIRTQEIIKGYLKKKKKTSPVEKIFKDKYEKEEIPKMSNKSDKINSIVVACKYHLPLEKKDLEFMCNLDFSKDLAFLNTDDLEKVNAWVRSEMNRHSNQVLFEPKEM